MRLSRGYTIEKGEQIVKKGQITFEGKISFVFEQSLNYFSLLL